MVLGCQSPATGQTSISKGQGGKTDKGFPPDSWVFQNDGSGSGA
jgi:hypothetical protein